MTPVTPLALETFYKIYCLQYADDIVLISESASGLQSTLDKTFDYCKKWHLNINRDKSKVVAVGSSFAFATNNFIFHIGNEAIDIVPSYNYLGVFIQSNRFYNEARDNMLQKANNCIFSLINKVISCNLNFDTAIHIFDSAVAPIMLYGSEIWNIPDLSAKKYTKFPEHLRIEESSREDPLERLQLRFLKYALGWKKSSMIESVLGDTGRYPLYVRCFKQMIGFWQHLRQADPNSLLYMAHVTDRHLANDGRDSWGFRFKSLLSYFGCEYLWDGDPINNLPKLCERVFKDKYDSFWGHKLRLAQLTDSKLACYASFKQFHVREPYTSLPFNLRQPLGKFRSSGHRLLIETGRHVRPKIERSERICKSCNLNVVENETHFLLECPFFRQERKCLLERIAPFIDRRLNDTELFIQIMRITDHEALVSIANFVRLATERAPDHISAWAIKPLLT